MKTRPSLGSAQATIHIVCLSIQNLHGLIQYSIVIFDSVTVIDVKESQIPSKRRD